MTIKISHIYQTSSVFAVSGGRSLDMRIVLIVRVFDLICRGSREGAHNSCFRDFTGSLGQENELQNPFHELEPNPKPPRLFSLPPPHDLWCPYRCCRTSSHHRNQNSAPPTLPRNTPQISSWVGDVLQDGKLLVGLHSQPGPLSPVHPPPHLLGRILS